MVINTHIKHLQENCVLINFILNEQIFYYLVEMHILLFIYY